jgi:hypothetical protein
MVSRIMTIRTTISKKALDIMTKKNATQHNDTKLKYTFIITLSIMAFSTMTLSIMPFSITTIIIMSK